MISRTKAGKKNQKRHFLTYRVAWTAKKNHWESHQEEIDVERLPNEKKRGKMESMTEIIETKNGDLKRQRSMSYWGCAKQKQKPSKKVQRRRGGKEG